jgi:predicted nicotinamide N-methyase
LTESCTLLGLRLRLITPSCALYTATAKAAAALPCGEPWWGFCWPGSYALAHLIQARPSMVRGKRVLDVGTGCGIAALAAVQAGAAHVVANDIDPYAGVALGMNAALCGYSAEATLEFCGENRIEGGGTSTAHDFGDFDVVLGGDICYEQPLATDVRRMLLRHTLQTDAERSVLVGDPGRGAFLDTFGALEGHQLTSIHSVELPEMVADTSNGMHTGTVWALTK